ncbi:MAG: HemK family protein methyltransferase [Fusobacterium sp.]|nr:HemK family protein methyltransferase [Fusobacterium sp.]
MNLLQILKFVEEYLQKYSFSKPRLEAEKLVSYVLNLDRISLYIYHERNLEEKEKDEIKSYLKLMTKKNKKFDEVKKEKKDFKSENLEIFNKSIEFLKKCGISSPKLDTEYIFADALKVNKNMLSFNMAREISEEIKDKIRKNIMARGKERKPLQYILGEWEFYGYPFKTDERALIPRSDTEILVEQVKNLMLEKDKNKEDINILDIGTGSGAISIALAKELENSKILGLDISQDAIDLANENKELNQVSNVKFILSNLYEKRS